MAMEDEVESTPFTSTTCDDDIDDPSELLVDMYGELKKLSKRNNQMKLKIDELLNDNSNLFCENKKLLDSIECLNIEK